MSERWASCWCPYRVSDEGRQVAATSVQAQVRVQVRAQKQEQPGAAADAVRLRGTAQSVCLKLQSRRWKAQAAVVGRHWRSCEAAPQKVSRTLQALRAQRRTLGHRRSKFHAELLLQPASPAPLPA